MEKKSKIILLVVGMAVLFGIVLYSGSGELFLGRIFNFSDPLPAYNENRCYESDGGKNYELAGTIYGKTSRFEYGNLTDVCSSRTKVMEYYCDEDFVQSEEYECQDGCNSGACKGVSKLEVGMADVGKSFDLNYSKYLSFDNGVKVYFGYYDFTGDGNKKFVSYSLKSVSGNDYLLSVKNAPLEFADVGSYEIPLTCPKLKISFKNVNENDFVVNLSEKQELNDEYCIAGFSDPSKVFDFDIYLDGFLKYFLDKNMFDSKIVEGEYLDLLKARLNESYDFLKNKLGSEPVYLDAISFITKFNPGPFPYQGGFSYIINNWEKVSEDDVNLMSKEGDVNPALTHELVHVFLYSTPVTKSWFEEGLADYMGALHSNDNNLQCFDDGWIQGNSLLVSYSDFSKSPVGGTSYDDPSNMGAYYKSAYCFWDYIEEVYGKKAVTNVFEDWFGLIKNNSQPKMKWLIKDVVNNSLGADLTGLVKKRYNYVEGY